jgi:hypothetical protein
VRIVQLHAIRTHSRRVVNGGAVDCALHGSGQRNIFFASNLRYAFRKKDSQKPGDFSYPCDLLRAAFLAIGRNLFYLRETA